MQERTRLKLEELRRLLKAEPQPMSMERAEELFRQAFPDVSDSYKGISKYRRKYPQYFKGIKIAAVTDEGDKLRDYLKRRSKTLTGDLNTDYNKLNKAAKTNLGPATVNDIVKKFNANSANKFLLTGGTASGASKYDDIYKNSKKFRTFYDSLDNYPAFEDATGNQKANAYKSFQVRGAFKPPAGYTLSSEEFLEKVGLKKSTLDTYVADPNKNNTSRFIKENFNFKIGAAPVGAFAAGKGTKQRYWKDPSEATLRKWDRFLNSKIITGNMKDRVEALYANDNIKDLIFKQKKLPSLPVVQAALNNQSPSIAANAMATLARVLKGDEFRGDIQIPKDVSAGKRLLNQIGDVGKRNAYRVAFYNAALANVDQFYKNEANASLGSFKTAFRDELKKILDIPEKGKVPFSVNEVIGISTGEMRGLQPYSAFVDVVRSDINEGPLAQYQGRLSRSIGRVQDALAVNDVKGAQKIADELIANVPTYKGFRDLSKAQLESLALPEIKIGTEIDPKIFSPAQLAEYKAKGLDIQGMAEDQLVVCSFLSNGGLPGDCANAIKKDPIKAAQIFENSPGTSTAMQKLKSAATSFLKSPGLRTFGKFGALGAGIGIVKQYMNDDASTYLSDEGQQKNMLKSMLLDPISPEDVFEESKTRPAILDYQLPVLAAEAAAGTAAVAPSTIKAARSTALGSPQSGITKTGLKTLGRGLATLGTPAGLLPIEAMNIGSQIAEGDSVADIASDPLNYLGAAFVGPVSDFATKGLSPRMAKFMRLGISPGALRAVSSRFGLPGLAISGGLSLYDYLNKKDD